MLRVAIKIGSTGPTRIGEAVAMRVYEIAQKRTDNAMLDPVISWVTALKQAPEKAS